MPISKKNRNGAARIVIWQFCEALLRQRLQEQRDDGHQVC
jgi:hypothetical protein